MALLSTRPNEATRLDQVRGRWVPIPFSYSPPRVSRRAAFCSVSATYSIARFYVNHMRPDGCFCLAQLGNLPLHYATMKETSKAVVKALFDAHPEGAKEKGQVCVPLSTLSPCAAQQNLLGSIHPPVLHPRANSPTHNVAYCRTISCHLTWPWNVDIQLRSSHCSCEERVRRH